MQIHGHQKNKALINFVWECQYNSFKTCNKLGTIDTCIIHSKDSDFQAFFLLWWCLPCEPTSSEWDSKNWFDYSFKLNTIQSRNSFEKTTHSLWKASQHLHSLFRIFVSWKQFLFLYFVQSDCQIEIKRYTEHRKTFRNIVRFLGINLIINQI